MEIQICSIVTIIFSLYCTGIILFSWGLCSIAETGNKNLDSNNPYTRNKDIVIESV